MKILHLKATPIAMAPDELSKAINKYSTFSSEVAGFGYGHAKQRNVDIIHHHNKINNLRNSVKFNKEVIQYHSEPFMVHLKTPLKKLVISQYHATLPEFKDCEIVRNVIDFNTPVYNPKIISNKIKIGFSPTRLKKATKWHDKGYETTVKTLQRLKRDFGIDYDIITKVPLETCLKRKNECNIIIDEVVTSSYHRSGLEGLALGKLTVCSLDDKVKKVLRESSGSFDIPFFDIWERTLYDDLSKIIKKGIPFILDEGEKSRKWMEEYWKPEDIVNEFIQIYKDL